jgi:hypothetical protein
VKRSSFSNSLFSLPQSGCNAGYTGTATAGGGRNPYRDAFNRLDGDAIANLYCVPSGIVSNRGLTAWQARAANRRKLVALCALYRANGYKQAHFQPSHFISQGTDFAVADVAWTIEREAGAAGGRENRTHPRIVSDAGRSDSVYSDGT